MRLGDLDAVVKSILWVRDNDLHYGYPRSHELGAIRKALRCVEETPTIDAVPVVRCKNCIYRDIAGTAPFMYYYCRNARGLSDVLRDDDFCPYGKEEFEC